MTTAIGAAMLVVALLGGSAFAVVVIVVWVRALASPLAHRGLPEVRHE